MTQEDFIKKYKKHKVIKDNLSQKLKEATKKLIEIERDYIATLPYKIGDCIRIQQDNELLEKCWIAEIHIFEWALEEINIKVYLPKKDGNMSRRMINKFYDVKPEQITVLNNE